MSPDFEVSANLRFWPVLEIATFELLAENRPFGIAQRHQFKCNGHSPLVAGCTHWDFKPERQLYDGEGAVQLNTDHRSGSLPSCLMTPRPTKERICVIAMAFNCVNRSGAESP